MIKLFY